MTEYTVFPNAPITEAILDIRVELPKEILPETLGEIHDNSYIKEVFPEKAPRATYKAGVKLSAKGETELLPTTGGHCGYFFKTSNKDKIVQVRLDGFTFNKLKPYESWDVFCSEAHKLWDIYSQATSPVKIKRIALRYINRIEVPLPIKDFKEYILTTPEVAPNLPQALSHFFMQLEIPNPAIQAIAIVTQTMENTIENTIENLRLPLILDIDVIHEAVFVDNQVEMWDKFEELRLFKNKIFFDSITEKTKELFK